MDAELKQRIEKAAAVLKAAGAREVYVFGSAVTGDRRPDSDVDLAVAGLPPQKFFAAAELPFDVLCHPLEDRLDARVEPVEHGAQRGPLDWIWLRVRGLCHKAAVHIQMAVETPELGQDLPLEPTPQAPTPSLGSGIP